jgi:hypothetical protein
VPISRARLRPTSTKCCPRSTVLRQNGPFGLIHVNH